MCWRDVFWQCDGVLVYSRGEQGKLLDVFGEELGNCSRLVNHSFTITKLQASRMPVLDGMLGMISSTAARVLTVLQ